MGFISALLAKRAQADDQMAPEGAKMAQDRPKTGQTQPKMVQALKIVDRAAVDRAVDLARTLLSGAQGPGPRAGDPIGT